MEVIIKGEHALATAMAQNLFTKAQVRRGPENVENYETDLSFVESIIVRLDPYDLDYYEITEVDGEVQVRYGNEIVHSHIIQEP